MSCLQSANEHLALIRDDSGFPLLPNKGFFDGFAVFDEKKRFEGYRLKFWCTLILGLDAESFYVRLNDHLKLKDLSVKFVVISVLPFFDSLNTCTEYRVCGLLELDKKVTTSCPDYFSPEGFNVVYAGLGDKSKSLSSHYLTTLILTNQLHADLPGWFYITPGWLSREQTAQLMWAGAVSFQIRFMFELVGLKLIWYGRFTTIHATRLTPKEFDLLYAFSFFQKDLDVKLALWLSQDASLSKSPSFDENVKLIGILLKKKRAFEVIEAELFQFKEFVPKDCISWVL